MRYKFLKAPVIFKKYVRERLSQISDVPRLIAYLGINLLFLWITHHKSVSVAVLPYPYSSLALYEIFLKRAIVGKVNGKGCLVLAGPGQGDIAARSLYGVGNIDPVFHGAVYVSVVHLFLPLI